MTPEEAKQLKAGDHILIEAVVRNLMMPNNQSPFCESGNTIGIRYKNELGHYENDYVCISNIREKIAPPRRKFRKGDIVRGALIGAVCFAIDDENDETELRISSVEDSDCGYHCKADFLTLLCAVEDRADRSAAADGSGVTGKGGRLE